MYTYMYMYTCMYITCIWLDMSHDGTVSTNFETFVKGCIVKSFVGETIYYIKHTEIMMLTQRS